MFFLIHYKNIKNITNFLFWVLWTCLPFGHAWPFPSKTITTTCRNCLSTWKKWTQSLTFFQDIANLLLWVLWECLIMMMMIRYIFLQILQSYCKFVTLGIFGMLGYAHRKWYNNIVENFHVICRQKTNFTLHHPPPSKFFLETLQKYANSLFWVLWACLVTHTHNNSINL